MRQGNLVRLDIVFLIRGVILFTMIGFTVLSCNNAPTSKKARSSGGDVIGSSSVVSESSTVSSSEINDSEPVEGIELLKEGKYSIKCTQNKSGLYESAISRYKAILNLKITSTSSPTVEEVVSLYTGSGCTTSNRVAKFDISSTITKLTVVDESKKIYKMYTQLTKATMTSYKEDVLNGIVGSVPGLSGLISFSKNETKDISSNPILINLVSGMIGSDITSSTIYVKEKDSSYVFSTSKKDLENSSRSIEFTYSE